MKLRRPLAAVLVALLFFALPHTASADVGPVSDSKATGVIIGAVGAVAGIGLVAYFLLRTPRTTGCTVSVPGGLELQADDAGRGTYALSGATGTLKPGEHVRVVGKKKGPQGNRVLTVDRVAKDFGACPASTPPPAH